MEENICVVIEKYKDCVYKTAYTYCKNSHDAEDIFQEVFLKYLKSRPVFNDAVHEKAWFIRVTVNCSKNLLKSSWFTKTSSLDENILCEDKEEKILIDSVMRLPKKYRIVVYLYYYEEYSIEEISKLLKRKVSTIQTQLKRARERLKNIVKEELL